MTTIYLNGFGIHITWENSRWGKDQHGDIWTMKGRKIIHESGVWEVDVP